MIRLLATGHPLDKARRKGLWVDVGELVLIGGLCISFAEDKQGGERVPVMITSPLHAPCPPAEFRLPLSEPLRYHHMARVELIPRAARIKGGRTVAVFIQYIDHGNPHPHGRSA